MKIFSNFDTRLRRDTFATYQKEYGKDHVICFGRSMLYRWYRVFFPGLIVLALSGAWLWFFYQWFAGAYFVYVLVFTLVLDIIFLFPIIGRYIDYKQDFIIVIPEALMMYDQGGLLRRNVVTVSTRAIKSISIRQHGLLYSMFNNGDIIVLSEGDITYGDGEITLRRVPHPEKRRQQIMQIIGIDPEGSVLSS